MRFLDSLLPTLLIKRQPVVATSPCGEKDQHLHVVHTNDGQVYALHGTEDSIKIWRIAPKETILSSRDRCSENKEHGFSTLTKNIL